MIGTGEASSHRMGRQRRALILLGYLFLLCSLPVRAAGPTTITFSLDFPNSDPERYSITVQSDGRAHYECSAKISSDSEDREAYQTEFVFSEATRARIFDL